MLNEILICNGYALPLVVKPNTKYADRFQKCYEKAVKEGRGLWRKK
jgi:micrococcal nuclease